MRIHPALAERAIQTHIATPLGMPVTQAAAGMARIVNANMAGATRLVSVEKGYDPRDFALLAFGGAGPLHAVAIAEELDIPWVVIPRHPGMTSAAGLVLADIVHNFVQTAVTELSQMTPQFLAHSFEALLQRATRTLAADSVPPAQRRYDRSLDLKYVGQGYTLNIAVLETQYTEATLQSIAEQFHARHEALYGFRADTEPVEMINLRLQATGVLDKPEVPTQPRGPRRPEAARAGERPAWVAAHQCLMTHHVFARAHLTAGQLLTGPAIVEQVDATTVIPPGWLGTVDGYGNLILGIQEGPQKALRPRSGAQEGPQKALRPRSGAQKGPEYGRH
jgi:N-methylhydantoinase A